MAHRCSICDRVSDKSLSNLPYGTFNGKWIPDPSDPLEYLCEECFEAISEDYWEEEEEEDSNDGQ